MKEVAELNHCEDEVLQGSTYSMELMRSLLDAECVFKPVFHSVEMQTLMADPEKHCCHTNWVLPRFACL